MFDYVTEELPALWRPNCRWCPGCAPSPATPWAATARWWLRCAARSCTAPCPPSRRSATRSPCGWGEGCFGAYLGDDRAAWAEYDATELVRAGRRFPGTPLIDQGTDDEFLADQLHPEALEAACLDQGQPLTLRRQPGYDHSYHFIASFIGEHLAYHAEALTPSP
jgi:S-formylglutathione hydrolase